MFLLAFRAPFYLTFFFFSKRSIKLIDTSKKRGLYLRILHGIAYRKGWFQGWDYSTVDDGYMTTLQKMGLVNLKYDVWQSDNWEILCSKRWGNLLETLSGLLEKMVSLVYEIPISKSGSTFRGKTLYRQFYNIAFDSKVLWGHGFMGMTQ